MENLLAMPVRPVEVMLGKIIPYVGLAYVQTLLILVVSVTVFAVPVRGSVPLLVFACGVFIACNLAMGFACGLVQIWPDLWPMALSAVVVGTIAVSMYRETLD